MNKEKYNLLTKTAQKFCKYLDSDIYYIFQANIPRYHNVYLKDYKILNKNNFVFYSQVFFKIFKNIFQRIIQMLRGIFVKKNIFETLKVKNVFVSHNFKQDNNFTDLYFSNFFKKKNIVDNSFVFIFNHSNKILESKNCNNFYINNISNFKDEIKIFLNQLRIFVKILNFKTVDQYEYKFKFFILTDLFSLETKKNFLFQLYLKRFLKKNKPKNLITPYEGQSYEKVALNKENYLDHKITSYGFVRTPMYKNHHFFFEPVNLKYYPDNIITAYKCDLFEKTIDVGSNYFSLEKVKNKFSSNIILLCPEGLVDETKNFIDLAKRDKNKKFKFIFRIHPILKNKLNLFNLPANIEISNKSLNDDLYEATYCIYRGTSVSYNCVASYVYPLYYDYSIFDVNSLEQFGNNFHYSKFQNFNDLQDILSMISDLEKKLEYNYDKSKIFFSKFDENKINFLN